MRERPDQSIWQRDLVAASFEEKQPARNRLSVATQGLVPTFLKEHKLLIDCKDDVADNVYYTLGIPVRVAQVSLRFSPIAVKPTRSAPLPGSKLACQQ